MYEDEESAEAALGKLANTELDTRKLFLRKVGVTAVICRVYLGGGGGGRWGRKGRERRGK